jgi:hypothetical protein
LGLWRNKQAYERRGIFARRGRAEKCIARDVDAGCNLIFIRAPLAVIVKREVHDAALALRRV